MDGRYGDEAGISIADNCRHPDIGAIRATSDGLELLAIQSLVLIYSLENL